MNPGNIASGPAGKSSPRRGEAGTNSVRRPFCNCDDQAMQLEPHRWFPPSMSIYIYISILPHTLSTLGDTAFCYSVSCYLDSGWYFCNQWPVTDQCYQRRGYSLSVSYMVQIRSFLRCVIFVRPDSNEHWFRSHYLGDAPSWIDPSLRLSAGGKKMHVQFEMVSGCLFSSQTYSPFPPPSQLLG